MTLLAQNFNQAADTLGLVEQGIGKATDAVKGLVDSTNFADGTPGQTPFFSTGARALIRVGGKPVGYAQRVRWSISYQATPIRTIDASHAWDVDIGQSNVNAELSSIIDPTAGMESLAIFHTMQSAIHQPFVEIQILDRSLGTSYFFARGMFVGISGSIGIGQVGQWTCQFQGTTYQHYVSQQFKPYNSVAGAVGSLVEGLQDIASDLTGGLF